MISLFKNYGVGELATYFIERKMGIRLPINSKTRWKWNIKSEIRFWDNCIKTNGHIWPEEFKLRKDSNLPLQDEIIALLQDEGEITILDVGAGPLTFIGKIYNKARIKITAVDPLADEYDKILKKYGVVPTIRTEKLDAENLSDNFSNDQFDLVFARNCIDHSYSPEKAIMEMIKVAKIHHYIYLKHRPNEAIAEDWQGLHQWNLSERNGDFIISSKEKETNFSEKYKALCEISCSYDSGEDMLNTVIYKK